MSNLLRIFIRILAVLVFIGHAAVVLIILFGWLMSSLWGIALLLTLISLVSDLLFGYCFLSKFEFVLRKKLDPSLDYDYSFSSYYTYKLTRKRLSEKFIVNTSRVLLIGLLGINIFIHVLT